MKAQLALGFLFVLLALALLSVVLASSLARSGVLLSKEVSRAGLQARADVASASVNLVYFQGGSLDYYPNVSSGSWQGCRVTLFEGNLSSSSYCVAAGAASISEVRVSGRRKWFG
ncbi:hypothetical protein HYS54_04275 [Candidatus Micrarchaeota archaeon]|nr:hypothetical protein [Candidatus Micrarchaeota archaeon]